MLYISGQDNHLAPGNNELHMQPEDEITVIMADGTEIWINGEGYAIGASGGIITSA